MAHYAFLDANSVVTEVIVGKDEGEGGVDWEQYYGQLRGKVCKRTSYNTKNGANGRNNKQFRKNFAGVGYTYDAVRDAFIPPKPFASWTLDEKTCAWVAPTPMPKGKATYFWNEATLSWLEIKRGS